MKIELGLRKMIYLTLRNYILFESAMEKAWWNWLFNKKLKTRLFVQEKVKADGKDVYGRTPLDIARTLKYNDIIKMLEQYILRERSTGGQNK